jgi:hypothetical protein
MLKGSIAGERVRSCSQGHALHAKSSPRRRRADRSSRMARLPMTFGQRWVARRLLPKPTSKTALIHVLQPVDIIAVSSFSSMDVCKSAANACNLRMAFAFVRQVCLPEPLCCWGRRPAVWQNLILRRSGTRRCPSIRCFRTAATPLLMAATPHSDARQAHQRGSIVPNLRPDQPKVARCHLNPL